MDTSGNYPQLSGDDPLFEIADYTDSLKTTLQKERVNITGGKNGAAPAVSTPITLVGQASVTTAANGTFTITFPTAFPNSCAAVFMTPFSGTAVFPVVNGGNITTTYVQGYLQGVASTAVTIAYVAYGW